MKSYEFTAAPFRPFEVLVDRCAHPGLIVGVPMFLLQIGMFVLTGSLHPSTVEELNENPMGITGAALMIASLPTYLLVCSIASLRLRRRIHTTIARLTGDSVDHRELRRRGIRLWPLGIIFGLLNASLNLPTYYLSFPKESPVFTLGVVLVVSQYFMWVVVGLVLFLIIQESIVLHHMGKRVRFSLYKLEELNDFGETALNSFLIIAGALALTTLQSLDLEFRWVNYRNGLIIGVPAALILVPLPVWNLHLRIRKPKKSCWKKLMRRSSNHQPRFRVIHCMR